MKRTRTALLMSVLALLLCASMFVGSTFAWFTDSVSSTNNIITAGNLDVVVEYKTSWNDAWKPVDETTKLFDDKALFEPGYTEVVFLRVSNAGSLALKYSMDVTVTEEKTSTNVYGDELKLSDYLQIGAYIQDEYVSGANYADLLMPTMFGTREAAISHISNFTKVTDVNYGNDKVLLPGNETAQVAAIVVNMPETVGNEANHKTGYDAPYIKLGLTVLATQHMEEEDSFGPDYDKDAEMPVIVKTMTELKAAANTPGAVIDAAGADLGKVSYVSYADGVTVKNAVISGSSNYGNRAYGTVIFENCVFRATGSYAAHFDTGSDDSHIIFRNCEFAGWNSFGTAIKNVTFEGCTFDSNGNYAVVRFYQDATVTNCTFTDAFARMDVNANVTVTLEGCTNYEGKLFNNGSAVGTWIVNGVDVSSTIA